MLRGYKTEIHPTEEQKILIHKTIGVCRFIYNFYISHNKSVYEEKGGFVSGMDFSKWINNEFLKENPEYNWIKEVGSKPVKKAIMNAEMAFIKFFKKKAKFPRFKKKGKSNVTAYFPRNSKTDFTVERHRIKIPTLGFVRLKEKGYIPSHIPVRSVTVSMEAGRYYISALIDDPEDHTFSEYQEGLGVDLGLKDFAIVSGFESAFGNINKTPEVKELEKRLRREQHKLSRKYESLKTRKKNAKGGTVTRQNIQKQLAKVQRLHKRLSDIRQNYINQVICEIVKTKPSYITIEDLNISGMMKNRHLSKAIAKQGFRRFREKLEAKCKKHGIELRVVDRFYPSSKTCSCCGSVKKDLKLSDREYRCAECGLVIDRDKNASLNLKHAASYSVA